MKTGIIILCVILALLVLILLFLFLFFKKRKNVNNFEPISIFNDPDSFFQTIVINNFLAMELSKDKSILKIKNPDSISGDDGIEILTKLIFKIEKTGSLLRIHYLKNGDKNVFDIEPITKETLDFIYDIYKNVCLKKIQKKFKNNDFKYISASSVIVDYLWAYDPYNTDFIYFNTDYEINKLKEEMYKIPLKYTKFELDTKTGYFEIPVLGKMFQLFVYESDFLDNIFNSFLEYIKFRTVEITKDTLYFDNYSDYLYLSDGYSRLRSLNIDEIKEVSYKDNRIIFLGFEDKKIPDFEANSKIIDAFQEFVTNYNLSKISKSFDNNKDKLINTTKRTKFIFEFSKNRCVYCADLNTFSGFSYVSIAFSSIIDVSLEKNSKIPYVRINTIENNTIDISTEKQEVADYIFATIKKIIVER